MTSYLNRVCLCLVMLAAACSSACLLSESCRLVNDSGSDVTIVRYRTGDGSSRQTAHLKVNASIILPEWESWELRMVKDGQVLRYVPRMPTSRFATDSWLGPVPGRIFTLQIDRSGRIYALGPDQSPPAKTFVGQPSGFPLTPVAPQLPGAL